MSRSRDLLRSSFENTPLTMPATSSPERVVKHLEESRFELDEKARCSRSTRPTAPQGAHRLGIALWGDCHDVKAGPHIDRSRPRVHHG